MVVALYCPSRVYAKKTKERLNNPQTAKKLQMVFSKLLSAWFFLDIVLFADSKIQLL